MLRFICSYFNFSNSKKVKKNYIKFRKNFPYDLTTIEVALPDQEFFIDDSIKITAQDNQILWQKERCLNIAIENLPSNTDSIAWVDTDVIFHNDRLLQDTEKSLSEYKVVQLFDQCLEKPKVNPYHNNYGIGKTLVDNLDIKLPAIGFAWGFRKDILLDNKLYDSNPVGNSDVLQLLTWLGVWNHKTIMDLSPAYRKEFLLWAWNSYEKVQGNVGYVNGTLEHIYHGKLYYRKYHDRNNILLKHNFIPSQDLTIDNNLLYSLKYKTSMISEILQYFESRKKHE